MVKDGLVQENAKKQLHTFDVYVILRFLKNGDKENDLTPTLSKRKKYIGPINLVQDLDKRVHLSVKKFISAHGGVFPSGDTSKGLDKRM